VQGNTGVGGATGTTGYQGPVGETGAVGPQGNQGITGVQGVQGIAGVAGPQGITGAVGTVGAQGETGSVGVQGITGAVGTVGAQGPTGTQGEQGIRGNTGAIGLQGYTGAVGVQGTTGYTGTVGPQGPTGDVGVQGTTGYTGSIGIQGLTGVIGLQGNQGITGIRGVTGSIGIQGLQGETGNVGTTGLQGPTGLIAEFLTHKLVLDTSGYIMQGKTAYGDPQQGIWIGNDGGVGKVNIGGTGTNMKWTGSSLEVTGPIIGTSNIQSGAISVFGDIAGPSTRVQVNFSSQTVLSGIIFSDASTEQTNVLYFSCFIGLIFGCSWYRIYLYRDSTLLNYWQVDSTITDMTFESFPFSFTYPHTPGLSNYTYYVKGLCESQYPYYNGVMFTHTSFKR
jgi:hypothetical protein